MKPDFSIIIPVYNNEKYFSHAVESVLEQTYKNFELIIIDDGSTDATSKIADDFALQDSRIHVIHQENQWIYASFNNGIAAAKGEYIYILNSDDKFESEYCLERLSEIVKKYNPDMIITDTKVYNYHTKESYILGDSIKEECFTDGKNNVRKKWIDFLKRGIIGNQANLYRTSIARRHKFRNDIYGGDYLYNAQIADDISSVAECNYPIYRYIIYNNDNMNASVGKFYNYEHNMRNEFFSTYYNLFLKWGLLTKETETYIVNTRFRHYTYELQTLLFDSCQLTLKEKLKKAWEWANDLCDLAEKNGRRDEWESRTLNGIKNIILKHYYEDAGNMQFIVDYLEAILRYEKTHKDMDKIKNAIYHDMNKNHIGISFYKKIKGALF